MNKKKCKHCQVKYHVARQKAKVKIGDFVPSLPGARPGAYPGPRLWRRKSPVAQRRQDGGLTR